MNMSVALAVEEPPHHVVRNSKFLCEVGDTKGRISMSDRSNLVVGEHPCVPRTVPASAALDAANRAARDAEHLGKLELGLLPLCAMPYSKSHGEGALRNPVSKKVLVDFHLLQEFFVRVGRLGVPVAHGFE